MVAGANQAGSLQPGAVVPASPTNIPDLRHVGIYAPENYNAAGDARSVTDCVTTAGSPIITSATAAFTQADVGKVAIVDRAGPTPTAALSAGLTGSTTISSLPVTALAAAIPAGTVHVVEGANSQWFSTTGAAIGATSIPVVSAVVNTNYTTAATVTGLAMPVVTTVLSVQSATQATLATNLSTSLTSVAQVELIIGTDDSAAFTSLLTAIPDWSKLRLYSPKYIVTVNLTANTRFTVEGVGAGGRKYNSTEIITTVSSGSALTLNKDGTWWIRAALRYMGSTPSAVTGVFAYTAYYNRFIDATFANFNICASVARGSEWHATRCTFYNPVQYGLEIQNLANGDEGDMGLVDCSFVCRDVSPTAAIHYISGGGLRMDVCKTNNDWRTDPSGTTHKDQCWQYAIYAPVGATTSDLLIGNSSLESFWQVGIQVQVGTGKTFGNINVKGTEFLAFAPSGNTIGNFNPQCLNAYSADANGITNVVVDDNNCNIIGGTSLAAFGFTNCRRVNVGSGNGNSGFPFIATYTTCTEVTDTAKRGFMFPSTVTDVRGVATASLVWTAANRAYWFRVRDGGSINNLVFYVITSSGNISFTINRGSKPGSPTARTDGPGAVIWSSGAIACPAIGDATVALGQTVTVQAGDWIGMSCDNTTASFRGAAPGLSSEAWMQGLIAYKDTSHPLDNSTPTGTSYRGDRLYVIGGTE